MSATHPPSPADMPVAIGDVLAGKYQVERVLGVGGMGVVVAARHMQLEQKVALKFLLPQAMQSSEAVERFKREARSAVRLRSEHVAKVIDVGELATGAPYMVMEFLEGADLSEVVRATGAISIEEAVAFVLQACEAIAEAHALGIIHRDLKPQNLFVTRRVDGKPLVKVLDFGISKTIDTQSGMALTRTSSIMGSPLYMSPEQMRSSKSVDQRSDIWALGVILYELLTGRVPFEAEAIPELCLKVVQDPVVPPKALRVEVPDALSAVVCQCLAKSPADRFANVAHLAAALEPFTIAGRGSAERIAATLKVPSHPPLVSSSDVLVASPKSGTGGTSWGSTQAVLARKKRTPLLLGGVAVAALAVVGFTVVALGGKKPTTTAAQPETPQTASAPAATIAPTVAPSVTSAATTETTAPTQPTTTGATTPRATATPKTQIKPTPTPSSGSGSKPAPTLTAPPKTFGE